MFDFFRKRQPVEKPLDFTTWESDFGFYNLISTRKKNITKSFLIDTYSDQKSDTDYVTDEEIMPIVESTITEILSNIGEKYKNFLIDKYFGTLENFTVFITEDVYVDLVTQTINRNVIKIRKKLQADALSRIQNLNSAQK